MSASSLGRQVLTALLVACGSASCSSQTGGSPGDGGGAQSASCRTVHASDYDQSCMVDDDCVAVGEVPSCPAAACDGCTTTAVNKTVMGQYMSALSAAFAGVASGPGCGCPCEGGVICRAGTCQAAFCAPPRSDTLPACADAGGACMFSANTTCAAMGPPDACAYSDEVCCTQ